MARVALVDADLILYREAAASEKRIQWSDDPSDVTFAVESEELALTRAEAAVEEILNTVKAEHAIFALSVPSAEGFRRTMVLPSYKAHRPSRKPEHMALLKDWLRKEYQVFERPLLEADDILGILATAPHMLKEFKSRVIVSGDKDLLTVPGTLFNPRTRKVMVTTVEEADMRFYTQVLTGDPTDGYAGIPGVGPAKAAVILADNENHDYSHAAVWSRIEAAYRRAGLTRMDAITQARVARILRHEDYDYRNRRPILWQPPTS